MQVPKANNNDNERGNFPNRERENANAFGRLWKNSTEENNPHDLKVRTIYTKEEKDFMKACDKKYKEDNKNIRRYSCAIL